MNRRDFIKIGGIAGSGSLILEGCGPAAKEALPVLISDEPIIPGEEQWKNTTCLLCEAGCGLQVRWMNGNAVKIEGNPQHPVNQGKTCSRAQAALQILYNPDRLRRPLRRAGTRGEGKWKEVSWEEALAEFAGEVKKQRSAADAPPIAFWVNPLRGTLEFLADRFVQAFQVRELTYLEAFAEENRQRANLFSLGTTQTPTYDLANANYVLSVGAPYLEGWVSPVRFARGLGQLKQGRPGRRGKSVHVEARLSMTAGSADEWVPIRPETEYAFLLALAHVLVRDGKYDKDLVAARGAGLDDSRSPAAGFRGFVLENFSPQKAAPLCGVREQTLERLARELAENGPSVVLAGGCAAGGRLGYSAMWAAHSLNLLLGGWGRPGGWSLLPRPPLSDPPPVSGTGRKDGGIGAQTPRLKVFGRKDFASAGLVVIRNCNPVHELPAFCKVEEALQKSGTVVAIGSFLDETNRFADLILPESTFLESWQDDIPESGAAQPTWSLVRPVLPPLYETRSFGDILLDVSRRIEPSLSAHFPWKSFEELLQARSRGLFESEEAAVREEGFDSFWSKVQDAGGWWPPAKAVKEERKPRFAGLEGSNAGKADLPEPRVSFDETVRILQDGSTEYPLRFSPYPSIHLAAGAQANLPMLQETPDPVTRKVWGSCVEVSPKLAAKLGLSEGDWATLESAQGRVRIQVHLYAGLDQDVVAVAAGQGHTGYGRYADNHGVNPLKVLSPVFDARTGAFAWQGTRVRLTKA